MRDCDQCFIELKDTDEVVSCAALKGHIFHASCYAKHEKHSEQNICT